MRQRTALALACMTLFQILGCGSAPGPGPVVEGPPASDTAGAAVVLARLPEVEGAVVVTSNGATTPASKDAPLGLRDRVAAQAGGRALLVYLGTARAQIRENSEVEVLSNGLRVRRGETWFNVVLRKDEFVVEAPGAVLAVLGTSFGVTVRPDGTTAVKVEEGTVQVRTRAGATDLTAGKEATIDAFGAVSAKAAAPLPGTVGTGLGGDRDALADPGLKMGAGSGGTEGSGS